MTLTCTFTDSELVSIPPTRKNGRIKYSWNKKEVVDTLHPITITFNNVTKVYYTRGMDAGKKLRTLYNENGDYAKGIWQHGQYGSKSHTEGIELNEFNKLIVRSSYASGQIKDQHKYLKAIL